MSVGNIIFISFVAIALMSLFAGEAMYKNDVEQNITRDIFNQTEHAFVWNESNFKITQYNSSEDLENGNFYTTRINNMINYGINGMGGSIFEFSKMFIEVGYNSKGQYDLGFFLKLLRIVFWFIIVGVLFMPAMFIGIASYEIVKYIKKKIKNK